jgi:hypothetical protein
MPTPSSKSTRAERLAQPLAREVAEQVAADHGVCIRPVSLRRKNTATGATEVIDAPCGSALESRCPACARHKRSLRRTRCEEGRRLFPDRLDGVAGAMDAARVRALATAA